MQTVNAAIKDTATRLAPFVLDDDPAYQDWRARKLADYPLEASRLVVAVQDPFRLSPAEQSALRERVRACNMALYQIDPALTDKALVSALGKQCGLTRLDSNLCADEDSITSLQVMPQGRQQGYIPYSNLRLSWHTDGYYNTPEHTIRAVMLHCVRPAAEGGENGLLDHEMVYIHLRDAQPAYISALMAPDVMTIPPNIEQGREIRPAQSGPVFSLHAPSGSLHMRYSHRMRNIEWKQDSLSQEALACLREFLDNDTRWVVRHRLEAGQGLLCNNVLHSRSAFSDAAAAARLLYRARYFDRIRDD